MPRPTHHLGVCQATKSHRKPAKVLFSTLLWYSLLFLEFGVLGEDILYSRFLQLVHAEPRRTLYVCNSDRD